MILSTLSGTVSKLSGGRFANAADSTAFQILFNDAVHAAAYEIDKEIHTQVERKERVLLARVMFAETAGVPAAYRAVGWSIVNRVGAPGFPNTLSGVIHERNQYQSIGGVLWIKARDPSQLTGPDASSYAKALKIANGILNGTILDPTRGATYFYSGNPSPWFEKEISLGELLPTDIVRPFKFLKQH